MSVIGRRREPVSGLPDHTASAMDYDDGFN